MHCRVASAGPAHRLARLAQPHHPPLPSPKPTSQQAKENEDPDGQAAAGFYALCPKDLKGVWDPGEGVRVDRARGTCPGALPSPNPSLPPQPASTAAEDTFQ